MNQMVCDDTDVFVLLHYLREKLHSFMTMQLPIQCRSCIDVNETAYKHASILALHARSNRLKFI